MGNWTVRWQILQKQLNWTRVMLTRITTGGNSEKLPKIITGLCPIWTTQFNFTHGSRDAYSLRAKVKLKLGVPEGAFDDCNIALLLDSRITTVSITLVSALFQLGKYSEAIDKINNLLQSNSQSGMLYYIRGMCYMKSGKNEAGNHDILTAQKLGFNPGQNEFTMDMK